MLGIIQVHFTKNNIFFVLSCCATNKVKAVYSSTSLGFRKVRREALQIIQEVAKKIETTSLQSIRCKDTRIQSF
jgi:hydroxymethylglutaryl-CoA reductase